VLADVRNFMTHCADTACTVGADDVIDATIDPDYAGTLTGVSVDIDGFFDLGTFDSVVGDATPSVANTSLMKINAPIVVTSFDDGNEGHLLFYHSNWTGVVFDCDGAGNLNCGTTDITIGIDDGTLWINQNSEWNLIGVFRQLWDGNNLYWVPTDIDTDYGAETVTSAWTFQNVLTVDGKLVLHEEIGFEGATVDGNMVNVAVSADPASSFTVKLPPEAAQIMYKDRKCVRIDNGRLATALQLETIWSAHAALTITGIWCEADAGSVGMDFNIDDGTPAGINGSDISCTSTGLLDESFAGSATMAKGDRLDLDVGTVTTAVRLTACFDFVED
jgi:hypothetical protein